jgi:hypothetical protein
MVLEYFTKRPHKQPQPEEQHEALKSPVLTDEDEKFLTRLTSESPPPPLPERPVVILDNGQKFEGKDAQVALIDGADKVPLPTSPPVDEKGNPLDPGKEDKTDAEEQKRKNYWSFLPNVPNLNFKGKRKDRAGTDLAAAAEAVKAGGIEAQKEAETSTSKDEKKNEEEELTSILDQLNLSAVNNRAFSFSRESQKLMDEFTQILKDIVNGVPTAYDDLEKLLTRSDKQLKGMYKNMPPFLQTLVKSLPAKMGATLAPELLAASSEKPGADAKKMGIETQSGKLKPGEKKKKRSRIPSLKSMIKSEGAVAGMLRSIVNFLKLRFPAFITGTNIIMSLAVFRKLLLHSRGFQAQY